MNEVNEVRISVISEKGKLWFSYGDLKFDRFSCRGEYYLGTLTLLREGEDDKKAIVLWHGTHAACPCFVGDGLIPDAYALSSLAAERLKVGDSLILRVPKQENFDFESLIRQDWTIRKACENLEPGKSYTSEEFFETMLDGISSCKAEAEKDTLSF
jgi:hypothetical protein